MSDSLVVTFEARIIPIDVPPFLELDVFRYLKLIVNFKDGSLITVNDNWTVKLTHNFGHLYVEWLPSLYYTETEL